VKENFANTVLVVNDDSDQLKLTQFILEREGYKVLTAEHGAEGLKVASKTSPDLVVSDVLMPVMDGIEMCRRIREVPDLQRIPVLLLSALRVDSESAVEGFRAGADDYLEIPYEPSRFIAKIERLFKRKRDEDARIQLIKMQNALRESRSELAYIKFALDESAIVSITDSEGQITYLNNKFCEISKYTYEELIGQKYFTISQNSHSPEFFAEIMQTIGSGNIWKGEIKSRSGSGGYYWTETTIVPALGDDGKPQKYIFISHDITESKEAGELLQHSETYYRALIENASDLISIIDADGKMSYQSPSVKRLLGYEHEEIIGSFCSDFVHPDDSEKAKNAIEKITQNPRQTVEIEVRFLHKDGFWRNFACTLTNLVDNPAIRGIVSNAFDVTERERAAQALRESEEQLRQAQKLESVGRLAGGIAHDFNNMLTAINGYSDLMLAKLSMDDPLRRNVEEIKKASMRSAELTRQLLAFSRRQIMQPIVVDINKIISEMTVMMRRLIGEDIQLVTSLSPDIGLIEADPGQLNQVVLNLVVNARDAMLHGGTIMIETERVFLDGHYASQHISVKPGNYVMLAVSDTGCGMDEETKNQIFEPFFTTKETEKGTGLGLSTVYGIIKQSGGNIWVYSEVGKGTTFKIYLPVIAETARASENPSAESDVGTGSETILLVEDEQVVRNLSREVLELCGYKVIEAENGVEALSICEKYEGKIDLLMTDVVMPKMGGRELAQILTNTYPRMKVLFTSGYTDDAIVRHGILDNGANFIQKPFTFETLARKVREVFDKQLIYK